MGHKCFSPLFFSLLVTKCSPRAPMARASRERPVLTRPATCSCPICASRPSIHHLTSPRADWPSQLGGIAHRWNSNNSQDFSYTFNTLAQLQNMTQDQLAQLSPAEKLDIFAGRYDYPTVQSEWQRTSPNDAQWEGLCHGALIGAVWRFGGDLTRTRQAGAPLPVILRPLTRLP